MTQEGMARAGQAAALREQGRLDEAEAAYRALLEEWPGWSVALAGLGLCARRRSDLAEAERRFAAAVAAAPGDRWARLEHAGVLRDLRRLDAAEAAYAEVLDAQPDQPQALLGLGLCARAHGDLALAERRFAEAVAAAPGDRWARLEHATTLRELRRLDDAEAAYAAVLRTHPDLPQALLGLGLCARARGDLARAEPLLAAAVAAAPGDRWARLEHAGVLRELGRLDAAEAGFAHLLRAHPGLPQALAGLGLCARRRGDLTGAERHLAEAARAAPHDRSIRLEHAAALRELDRPDAATAIYAELLRAHPDWPPALIGAGLCARARGDLAQAERHFAAALAREPQDAGARLEHAAMLRLLGRAAEAAAAYRALLADRPDLSHAAFGLGLSLRLLGEREAALAVLRDGCRRWPQPHFLAELAAEAQALGRLEELEAWLEEAAAQPALAALALTLRGERARLAQRHAEALDLLGRARALPDAPQGASLGLAHTLAELGRPEEALAALAALATPEAAATRIYLLRRLGRHAEARAAARAAAQAAPARHFGVWLERFETERLTGTGPALDALLEAAPATETAERAMLCHARGALAEQRWDLAAAAAQFHAALALDGTLVWTHDALARIAMKQCDAETARTHLLARQRLEAAELRRRGQSPHLAHTHMGQVLDEFLFDPAALRAAADALALPDPERRVATLLRLVRAAPGHTPGALALAVALRRAGRLAAPASASPADAAIPRRIAQYWDAPAPPADVASAMRSWTEHNPDHAYRRFDLAGGGEYLRAHAAAEVVAAYRRARRPAVKADLFRLAWLLREGGVYADADDRCLAPLAGLLPPGAGLVLYQEEFGTLGNSFIAAAPHHPVLALALRHAVAAINRGDDDMPWLATGPALMTRAFAEALATAPMAWLDRACVLDRHELARGVAAHCMLGYKVSPTH